MARIELRDCTIRLKDGLSGSAAVNDPMATLMIGATAIPIDGVSLNTDDATLVPVGARLTIAGDATIYTVTARDPSSAGPTTEITVSPALEAAPVDDAAITFLPQQIDVKIGDGNLTYTEAKDYQYLLDRGDLDTVREGDQIPMEVSLEAVYEFITTGTGEKITPIDAMKGRGGASEWVSAAADPCEPYAVDLEVEHNPPCGTAESETTLFPDFRYDSLEPDLGESVISVTGRCNATEPTITRE